MFNPENELGVIVVFAQQCEEAGFEIISIQQGFPDARVKHGDVILRVEFEYCSSNFDQHGHDPREADLIICWRYDADNVLPTLALSENGWQHKEIKLPTQAEREAAYWQIRALRAERETKTVKNELAILRQSLTEQGEDPLNLTLALFVRNPRMTQLEAANILGVTRQAVGKRLQRLEEQGRVVRNGSGIEVLVPQAVEDAAQGEG